MGGSHLPLPALISPRAPQNGLGGRAESRGGAEPSQALPSRARAQAGSPWGCRVTPLARPPNHCRGEIFRGIIIRDSMVRISGTGEGKEREREVRAGGAHGGTGSPAQAGGPQSGWGPAHQCNKRSHPSPSSSRPRSASPPGTADPCRLWGEDGAGTLSPPAQPPGRGSPGGGTPLPQR